MKLLEPQELRVVESELELRCTDSHPAVAKYHRTKTLVLEVRSLRSGCWHGWVQRGLASWLADGSLVTVCSQGLLRAGAWGKSLSLPLLIRPQVISE